MCIGLEVLMKTFLECRKNLEKVWYFGGVLTSSFMNHSKQMEFLTLFFIFDIMPYV